MAWTKLGSTKVASELGTAANGTNTGVTLLGNASEIVMGNSGATNLTTTYLTYKKITGLTVGATIDRVLFYVYSCSNTSFKGAVYDHDASNDRPDTMLGSQGEITGVSVSNTNTEKEITLGSSATVGSSGIVWVAIIPNNDTYVATGVAESGGASTSYSVYDASSNGLYSDYANNLRSTAIYQGAGSNNIKYGVYKNRYAVHIKNTTIDSSKAFDSLVKEDMQNIDKFGDWYNLVSPKIHIKSKLFNKYV